MRYRKEDNHFVVVLGKGEEIVEALNKFFAEQGVKGGFVSGIGAVDEAEIGFYDLARKEYAWKCIEEKNIELLSLAGTISETGLHAHVVLAGKDFQALGGHLKRARVSATCELFVFPANEIKREKDEETGLELMKP